MLVALTLLVLGLLVLIGAWRVRRSTGIPWARVAASDTGGRRVEQPLFAPRYRLVGKPDYLIVHGRTFIPVEVKPSRRAQEPYYGDMMQLAAYCLLVEETSGHAPHYGLLRYAETTFRIPYTREVRDELLALLEDMRDDEAAFDCDRDHDEARRCRGCGFYAVCEQAIR